MVVVVVLLTKITNISRRHGIVFPNWYTLIWVTTVLVSLPLYLHLPICIKLCVSLKYITTHCATAALKRTWLVRYLITSLLISTTPHHFTLAQAQTHHLRKCKARSSVRVRMIRIKMKMMMRIVCYDMVMSEINCYQLIN